MEWVGAGTAEYGPGTIGGPPWYQNLSHDATLKLRDTGCTAVRRDKASCNVAMLLDLHRPVSRPHGPQNMVWSLI